MSAEDTATEKPKPLTAAEEKVEYYTGLIKICEGYVADSLRIYRQKIEESGGEPSYLQDHIGTLQQRFLTLREHGRNAPQEYAQAVERLRVVAADAEATGAFHLKERFEELITAPQTQVEGAK